MPSKGNDRLARSGWEPGAKTVYGEPPPLDKDHLLNLYVSQPGAKDPTLPLCWGVVKGRPCYRVAIKGRRLCWHCERGIE